MVNIPECMDEKKICHIIGAGPVFGIVPEIGEEDLLVVADGGLLYSDELGLHPDYIVGDFDSLGFLPERENVTVLPRVKDDTDMFAAITLGLERGYDRFYIYGGTGGREDHTIANIQLLSYLTLKGARGYLFGEQNILTMIKDFCITFKKEASGFVSVFSFGEKAQGVSISNMKYTLDSRVLTNSFPLGVSNEFTGEKAEISVGEGSLLLVYERQ